ncbi:MAG TPA: hypothetical protein VK731_12540 [Candidatus Cybelea sp.]|nr:hypothetical protein [Candidatus Cybelea sp.]
MKMITLALIGFGFCLQANCSTLTTTDGATYNNITAQRVDPDGLYIEYTTAGGGLGMSKVKFSRLSSDQQKQFGFDPAKAREYEASVAKATDDFRQESARMEQIASAARQARAEQDARTANDRAVAMAQLQAAQANSTGISPGGSAYDWSYLDGGGGVGIFAIPRTGRVPRARTVYAPIVTPIPFPRINTPRSTR